MSGMVYECVVNESHPQRKFLAMQQEAPLCCSRPMALLRAATAAASAVPPARRRAPQTCKTPEKS